LGKAERMPSSHGKQKQQDKQRKKRDLARQRHARRPPVHPGREALLRQAAELPHGPAFVSADFVETRMDPPRLVSVIVTRRAPGGIVLPSLALVDRTCLGVKNGFVAEPMSAPVFAEFARQVGQAHEGGMVACELSVAQSIVFHAVDYAASLGFEPHPDFPEILFGPRPVPLRPTPLARPPRPFWVRGPGDDAEAILAALDEAVGEGNYDVAMISGV
jgi:hypothetical protein